MWKTGPHLLHLKKIVEDAITLLNVISCAGKLYIA